MKCTVCLKEIVDTTLIDSMCPICYNNQDYVSNSDIQICEKCGKIKIPKMNLKCWCEDDV